MRVWQRVEAALAWRWFGPLTNGFFCAVLGPLNALEPDSGWTRLGMFLAGVLGGYAIFGVAHALHPRPVFTAAEEADMRQQLEKISEEVIAEIRARHPDMEIRHGDDTGVRH